MTTYRVIHTIDLAGDEEYFVIPEPNWDEYPSIPDDDPYWFDSDIAWNVSDFTNPEIYRSVDVTMVTV